MTHGRFITLEGIEGAGKSTLAVHLRDWLASRDVAVRLTREPGGTKLGEGIRDVVLTRTAQEVAPIAETLLMFAARAQHMKEVIRPELARGRWVICDRFTDATRAYQGAGCGVDGAFIERLATEVHGDLIPDLTLLLDLPAATGLSRARGRDLTTDRFEAETEAFFERVRAGYLALAQREPERFCVIDAAAPPGDVQARAAAAVERLLSRR
jgi:dTMP kinase